MGTFLGMWHLLQVSKFTPLDQPPTYPPRCSGKGRVVALALYASQLSAILDNSSLNSSHIRRWVFCWISPPGLGPKKFHWNSCLSVFFDEKSVISLKAWYESTELWNDLGTMASGFFYILMFDGVKFSVSHYSHRKLRFWTWKITPWKGTNTSSSTSILRFPSTKPPTKNRIHLRDFQRFEGINLHGDMITPTG